MIPAGQRDITTVMEICKVDIAAILANNAHQHHDIAQILAQLARKLDSVTDLAQRMADIVLSSATRRYDASLTVQHAAEHLAQLTRAEAIRECMETVARPLRHPVRIPAPRRRDTL